MGTSSATTWARPASQTCTAQDRNQRPGRTALPAAAIRTACSSVCRYLLTPAISTVATSHRTVPSSSDTGIQVRRAGSRSPPGTGHLELWRNALEPRRQPGLTFNRMQQNILFRPSPKIKNKPFLSELNNFRYYLCKDNFRIICICLRFCLHIIGTCNNATPFSDGERSRPQFQDPLYGSARFLEHAHGFVPSMLAFYILSLARKLPMHLQPHPACKACCHCRSMRRPCCSMVVAGR
ncbi:hypothetical protein CKU38_00643 [Xanthomonas citri pv. fuscans]|nr:hypothetical protein CKU38_00643 [Xanthomonas citri pv. fuscans]